MYWKIVDQIIINIRNTTSEIYTQILNLIITDVIL
jgi:hypothetical protein